MKIRLFTYYLNILLLMVFVADAAAQPVPSPTQTLVQFKKSRLFCDITASELWKLSKKTNQLGKVTNTKKFKKKLKKKKRKAKRTLKRQKALNYKKGIKKARKGLKNIKAKLKFISDCLKGNLGNGNSGGGSGGGGSGGGSGGGGGSGNNPGGNPPQQNPVVVQKFSQIETMIGDVEFSKKNGQQCSGYDYIASETCTDPINDKNPACFKPTGCAENNNLTKTLSGGLMKGDTASTFVHNGMTFVVWNDTGGLPEDNQGCGGLETIGYFDPNDADPSDGLALKPVVVNGEKRFYGLATPKFVIGDPHPQSGPCFGGILDGASDGQKMYIFYGDSKSPVTIQGSQYLTQRGAVASSSDNGNTWIHEFDFSTEMGVGPNGNCVETNGTLSDCTNKFARLQAVRVEANQFPGDLWVGHPAGYLLYGVSLIRSLLYLAFIPESDLSSGAQVRYYTASGWGPAGASSDQAHMDAAFPVFTGQTLFGLGYSIIYEAALGRWIMTYVDSGSLPGQGPYTDPGNVYVTFAASPVGPWSAPLKLLDVRGSKEGFGQFMHLSDNGAGKTSCTQLPGGEYVINPESQQSDFLWIHPPFQTNWACSTGWPYGPYMVEGYTTTSGLPANQVRIYMTLSPWIPYITVLGDVVVGLQ